MLQLQQDAAAPSLTVRDVRRGAKGRRIALFDPTDATQPATAGFVVAIDYQVGSDKDADLLRRARQVNRSRGVKTRTNRSRLRLGRTRGASASYTWPQTQLTLHELKFGPGIGLTKYVCQVSRGPAEFGSELRSRHGVALGQGKCLTEE